MKRLALGMAAVAILGLARAGAGDAGGIKGPKEDWEYAAAMKEVAGKFKGNKGVFLHLGDSITYANANTGWARSGQGMTPEEKAFVQWSHAGEKNDSDGWHLASVDKPGGHSETACSGIRADQYLQGGKSGMASLADIIKKYNPQLALYMLGTNDIAAKRPVAAYSADVEKAMDLLLGNGTVVILSTLPPFRGKGAEVQEYNKALRELAAKKKLPLLDLYGEMKARAGDAMEDNYLSKDGVHPTVGTPPPSEESLKKGGYLLRCYLAVHKGMEVRAKVFEGK